jgi:DNA-binding CsgD family transcriptional regulator
MLEELRRLVAETNPPVEELCQTAAERTAAIHDDTCIVGVLSDDRRWLHPLGLADPDCEVAVTLEALVGMPMRADRGLTRHVVTSRASVLLPVTSPEVIATGRPEMADYAARHGVCSAMMAPMRVRGESLGIVVVLRHRADAPLTPDDEHLTQVTADWLGLAVRSGGELVSPAPRASGDAGADLSLREQEVLALLALGHTNREIAGRLHLSVRTIEWHRSRIRWKLGASGRAALADAARAAGLID